MLGDEASASSCQLLAARGVPFDFAALIAQRIIVGLQRLHLMIAVKYFIRENHATPTWSHALLRFTVEGGLVRRHSAAADGEARIISRLVTCAVASSARRYVTPFQSARTFRFIFARNRAARLPAAT